MLISNSLLVTAIKLKVKCRVHMDMCCWFVFYKILPYWNLHFFKEILCTKMSWPCISSR